MSHPVIIDYSTTPRFSGITVQTDKTGTSIIVPPPSSWRTMTALCIAALSIASVVVFTVHQAFGANLPWSSRISYAFQALWFGGFFGFFIVIGLLGFVRAKGRPTILSVEGKKLIIQVPEWKLPRHELPITENLSITAKYIGILATCRRAGRLIIKDNDFELVLFDERNWRDIQWIAQALRQCVVPDPSPSNLGEG